MKTTKAELASYLTANNATGKTYTEKDVNDKMLNQFNTDYPTFLKKYPDYDPTDTEDYAGKSDDDFINLLIKIGDLGNIKIIESDMSTTDYEEFVNGVSTICEGYEEIERSGEEGVTDFVNEEGDVVGTWDDKTMSGTCNMGINEASSKGKEVIEGTLKSVYDQVKNHKAKDFLAVANVDREGYGERHTGKKKEILSELKDLLDSGKYDDAKASVSIQTNTIVEDEETKPAEEQNMNESKITDIINFAKAYKVNVQQIDIDELKGCTREEFKSYFGIPEDADEDPKYARDKNFDEKSLSKLHESEEEKPAEEEQELPFNEKLNAIYDHLYEEDSEKLDDFEATVTPYMEPAEDDNIKVAESRINEAQEIVSKWIKDNGLDTKISSSNFSLIKQVNESNEFSFDDAMLDTVEKAVEKIPAECKTDGCMCTITDGTNTYKFKWNGDDSGEAEQITESNDADDSVFMKAEDINKGVEDAIKSCGVETSKKGETVEIYGKSKNVQKFLGLMKVQGVDVQLEESVQHDPNDANDTQDSPGEGAVNENGEPFEDDTEDVNEDFTRDGDGKFSGSNGGPSTSHKVDKEKGHIKMANKDDVDSTVKKLTDSGISPDHIKKTGKNQDTLKFINHHTFKNAAKAMGESFEEDEPTQVNEHCQEKINLLLNAIVEDSWTQEQFDEVVGMINSGPYPEEDKNKLIELLTQYANVCTSANQNDDECTSIRSAIGELNTKIHTNVDAEDASEGEEDDKPFMTGDKAKELVERLLESSEQEPFGEEGDKKFGFYEDNDTFVAYDNRESKLNTAICESEEEAKDWLKEQGCEMDDDSQSIEEGTMPTIDFLKKRIDQIWGFKGGEDDNTLHKADIDELIKKANLRVPAEDIIKLLTDNGWDVVGDHNESDEAGNDNDLEPLPTYESFVANRKK